MEFKPGNAERRHDRRICPKCERHCGTEKKCPRCGVATRARIRIVWFIGESRKRKLTNCWREDEARQVLERIEADYWRQQRLGVSRSVGGTFDDAAHAFMDVKSELSQEWQAQIRTALASLRVWLTEPLGGAGNVQVTEILREHLQQYLADGLMTRAPTTMRSYMIVVRCLFRWLADEGWIRFDPARTIKLPRAACRHADVLWPEQVSPVITASWRVCPDFAPIAMAIMLGSFRKGEVVNLRRDEMNLATRWAYVLDFDGDGDGDNKHAGAPGRASPGAAAGIDTGAAGADAWSPKTASSRRAVPLHPLLAETLAAMPPVLRPDGTPSPWVFPVTDARKKRRKRDARGRAQLATGDRRSPNTTWFGKCLRAALAEAGIGHRVTLHGLRRTFAVLLQETGAPDSVIRQAMGHAAKGVTERHYLPRRDKIVQMWVDRIRLDVPLGGWQSTAPNLPPGLDFQPEK